MKTQNYAMFSDNVFSCDVSFDYNTVSKGKANSYPVSYRLYYIKTENDWLVYDLENLMTCGNRPGKAAHATVPGRFSVVPARQHSPAGGNDFRDDSQPFPAQNVLRFTNIKFPLHAKKT